MSGWNDERDEELRTLVAEGHPYSVVGVRMGISRNAAIGRAARLKIAQSRSAKNAPRKRKPTGRKLYLSPDKLAIAKARAQMRTEPDIVVPPGERRGVLDLERDDCRWPIGDPRAPDFTFCNGKKIAGLPYCDFHARLAYEAPAVRAGTKREAAKTRELEAA